MELITKRLEANVKGRIGPGITNDKPMRVLRRAVHMAQTVIEYEADPCHGEIIGRELGLTAESKSAATPGTQTKWEDLEIEGGQWGLKHALGIEVSLRVGITFPSTGQV